jgi:hypothetical protein
MTDLLLRRVSPRAGADGPEDYDVMSTHDGLVIGRIGQATCVSEGNHQVRRDLFFPCFCLR